MLTCVPPKRRISHLPRRLATHRLPRLAQSSPVTLRLQTLKLSDSIHRSSSFKDSISSMRFAQMTESPWRHLVQRHKRVLRQRKNPSSSTRSPKPSTPLRPIVIEPQRVIDEITRDLSDHSSRVSSGILSSTSSSSPSAIPLRASSPVLPPRTSSTTTTSSLHQHSIMTTMSPQRSISSPIPPPLLVNDPDPDLSSLSPTSSSLPPHQTSPLPSDFLIHSRRLSTTTNTSVTFTPTPTGRASTSSTLKRFVLDSPSILGSIPPRQTSPTIYRLTKNKQQNVVSLESTNPFQTIDSIRSNELKKRKKVVNEKYSVREFEKRKRGGGKIRPGAGGGWKAPIVYPSVGMGQSLNSSVMGSSSSLSFQRLKSTVNLNQEQQRQQEKKRQQLTTLNVLTPSASSQRLFQTRGHLLPDSRALHQEENQRANVERIRLMHESARNERERLRRMKRIAHQKKTQEILSQFHGNHGNPLIVVKQAVFGHLMRDVAEVSSPIRSSLFEKKPPVPRQSSSQGRRKKRRRRRRRRVKRVNEVSTSIRMKEEENQVRISDSPMTGWTVQQQEEEEEEKPKPKKKKKETITKHLNVPTIIVRDRSVERLLDLRNSPRRTIRLSEPVSPPCPPVPPVLPPSSSSSGMPSSSGLPEIVIEEEERHEYLQNVKSVIEDFLDDDFLDQFEQGEDSFW